MGHFSSFLHTSTLRTMDDRVESIIESTPGIPLYLAIGFGKEERMYQSSKSQSNQVLILPSPVLSGLLSSI